MTGSDLVYWLVLATLFGVAIVGVGIAAFLLAMLGRLHQAYARALRDIARVAEYTIRRVGTQSKAITSMTADEYKKIQADNRERIRQLVKDPEAALKDPENRGGAEFESGA